MGATADGIDLNTMIILNKYGEGLGKCVAEVPAKRIGMTLNKNDPLAHGGAPSKHGKYYSCIGRLL